MLCTGSTAAHAIQFMFVIPFVYIYRTQFLHIPELTIPYHFIYFILQISDVANNYIGPNGQIPLKCHNKFRTCYLRDFLLSHRKTYYNKMLFKIIINIQALILENLYVDSCRRPRIFLKRRPLSCEVPSRRDSVGGG